MLRPLAEKMITLAKRGIVNGKADPAREVHARRLAASRLPKVRVVDGEEVNVVKRLFDDIAPRYAERPGGYTRMVKTGKRPGDNAEMAVLMLVSGEES